MNADLERHAIYLAEDDADVASLVGLVPERMVVPLDLHDVANADDLFRVFTEELAIPYPTTSFDALLGWLSNLEWFGRTEGYLLVLRGLGEFREEAAEPFDHLLKILPTVCDRWRTDGTPFGLVLVGDRSALARAEAGLAKGNDWLVAAARMPWIKDTKPAEVIDLRR